MTALVCEPGTASLQVSTRSVPSLAWQVMYYIGCGSVRLHDWPQL